MFLRRTLFYLKVACDVSSRMPTTSPIYYVCLMTTDTATILHIQALPSIAVCMPWYLCTYIERTIQKATLPGGGGFSVFAGKMWAPPLPPSPSPPRALAESGYASTRLYVFYGLIWAISCFRWFYFDKIGASPSKDCQNLSATFWQIAKSGCPPQKHPTPVMFSEWFLTLLVLYTYLSITVITGTSNEDLHQWIHVK